MAQPTDIYPSQFEERIEFNLIRSDLRTLCDNEVSRNMTDRMTFISDSSTLFERLNQVEEMIQLQQSSLDIPSMIFNDIRSHILSIKADGSYLTEEGLFALDQLLTACHQIKRFISSIAAESSENSLSLPALKRLADEIEDLPDIRRRIGNIIDEEGKIKDTASKELRKIRSDIKELTGSVGKTIQVLLKNAQAQGWVDKDAQPILREGRLLLPITPSAKREVKGIVQDESATGKTLFVEPEQLVETNNKIREKQSEEKREIIRILKEFTSILRPYIRTLQFNCTLIGILDFARAKSKLAHKHQAIVPRISDEQVMDWVEARHPLLEQHLKSQYKPIVPLDISLSPKHRLLVISGPNAGGKSVCLKTVAMLQYMLQCGLAIPVKENSQCRIFNKIFLDIGDDQSLENDLSTYSSHLIKMKYFTKHADDQTLILIDEFGSGTEPIIGGAIAEAVLRSFLDQHCIGVITTHYGNLKDFCEINKGAINGAMLFDRQKIRPLYKLYIGKPGSSFAIEIAQKIGLSPSIIEYATNLVGTDYVMQDKYLQDIMRDKKYWEEKRQKIRKREKQIEALEDKLKGKLEQINTKRNDIIAKAEEQAVQIVSSANATVERTIREIKESNAEREATLRARAHLSNKKSLLEKQIAEPKASKKKSANKQDSKKVPATTVPSIEVGSYVTVSGGNEVGEVIEIKKKKAQIKLGNLSMTIPINKLTATSRKPAGVKTSKPKVIEAQGDERRLNFKPQLDCRGMRVDEALQSVIYFLDDAVRFNYTPVRILHGTGTGALREAIRQQLSAYPMVSTYRDEHLDLGGPGITVVELHL